mgnify:CR=1 FL=1
MTITEIRRIVEKYTNGKKADVVSSSKCPAGGEHEFRPLVTLWQNGLETLPVFVCVKCKGIKAGTESVHISDTIDMGGGKISNVGAPTASTDAARKQEVDSHAGSTQNVHGVGSNYICKTSRSDQWPDWGDIQNKPSTYPPSTHGNDAHDPDFTPLSDFNSHKDAKTGVHGVGSNYVCKTSRSDQWPDWNDIQNKPSSYPPGTHGNEAHSPDFLAVDGSNSMQANLNMAQHQVKNMLFDCLTSDPSSPAEGQVWYRTDQDRLYLRTSANKVVFPAQWGDIEGKPSTYPPSTHGNEAHDPDFTPLSDFNAHKDATQNVHGVGSNYVCKTSRSDQWPDWNDIQNKPSTYPPSTHGNEAHSPDFLAADGSVPLAGDLVPDSAHTRDIGSSTKPLYEVHSHWFTSYGTGSGDPVISLKPVDATSTATTRIGGRIIFYPKYWDGYQSRSKAFHIEAEMINTAGKSKLKFRGLDPSNNDVEFMSITNEKELIPPSDNEGYIGTSSYRFKEGHFVDLYTGDICFEEEEDIETGEKFQEGDLVVLKVIKVENGIRCVPVKARR